MNSASTDQQADRQRAARIPTNDEPLEEELRATGAPSRLDYPNLSAAFVRDLRRLLAAASPRRRVQLLIVLFLTVLATLADLVTIGAVLPLLSFAAFPEGLDRLPLVRDLLGSLSNLIGQSLLLTAALLLSVAAIASMCIRLLLGWTSSQFSFGLLEDLVLTIYSKALHQPYSWYVKQNSATLLSGLEKITLMIYAVIVPGIQAASACFAAIFVAGFLMLINPVVALSALAMMAVVYGLVGLTVSKVLKQASLELAQLRTSRVQSVQESLGGIREILLENSQGVFEENLRSIEDRVRRNLVASGFVAVLPRLLAEGLAVLLLAGLTMWFSSRPGGLLIAIPTLGAAAVGAQRLLPMVQAVYLGWASYSTYAQSIGDVVQLLEAPIEEDDAASATEAISFTKTIALQDVTLKYDAESVALHDLNMTIEKGDRVGIIGKTGGGKSSLADVLMGLLPATEGNLMVDDTIIHPSNVVEWRRQVSHVPQTIFLKDASIAENIGFGTNHAEIEIDQVADAARRAGLDEFVCNLPDGLWTTIGERGIRLSGGQRQRIGIARALYRKASVLVLDEATNALDHRTEAEILQSVADLGPEVTVIMIAHRLSTLSVCNRVFELESGTIVRAGTFEQIVMGNQQIGASEEGISS